MEAAAGAHRLTGVLSPHPLRREGRAGSSRCCLLGEARRRCRRHIAPEPRRQGGRSRLLHRRAARDRGLRRVRRVVPLGGRRQRHDAPPRVGRRGRSGTSVDARDGRGAPGVLRGRTAGRPGLTWLLDGFTAAWPPAASVPTSGVDCSSRTRPGLRVRGRHHAEATHDADRSLTSVVGSHARPSWFVAGIDAAERGEFGPADLREMLDDAVDIAMRDQEDAGVDVVSRRRDAPRRLLHGRVLRHLTGVRALPPDRQLGPAGTTSSTGSRCSSRSPRRTASASSRSTGTRATRDARPLKVTIPGPYTLSGRLRTARARSTRARRRGRGVRADPARRAGGARRGRARRSSRSTSPSPAIHPDAPADFAALFNAAVERRRARAARRPPLLRQLPRSTAGAAARTGRSSTRCSASASTSSCSSSPTARWPRSSSSARSPPPAGTSRAGLIDVKNYHLETAEDVAERIDAVLPPASRPSGSRSSPTAASARPRAGRRPPSSAPSSPAATSSRLAPQTKEDPWTATASRCSGPG